MVAPTNNNFFVGLTATSAGCGGNTGDGAGLSGSIKIIGSNTVTPLTFIWAEEFMKMHPKVRIAVIGPSGCGNSSYLRLFNRMNDLITGARVEGRVEIGGISIYENSIDVVELRKRVGMVFQKPNPFPISVFENVAFGPRRHGRKDRRELEDIVERSLRQAALWEA